MRTRGEGCVNMTKSTHFVCMFIENATLSETLKDRRHLSAWNSLDLLNVNFISSKNKSDKNVRKRGGGGSFRCVQGWWGGGSKNQEKMRT